MAEFTEFWSETVTRQSWLELTRLAAETDFVLIGGWAVFLWTGRQKSRDIDIVVDFKTLSFLKENYGLEKNEALKKYQVKTADYDIDVYVPFYSPLAVPPERLLKNFTVIRGIKTARAEELLALKLGALRDRRDSVKGAKDEVDVLSLLTALDVDWKKFATLLSECMEEGLWLELESCVKDYNTRDLHYLGLNFKEFRDWQKKTLETMKTSGSKTKRER